MWNTNIRPLYHPLSNDDKPKRKLTITIFFLYILIICINLIGQTLDTKKTESSGILSSAKLRLIDNDDDDDDDM